MSVFVAWSALLHYCRKLLTPLVKQFLVVHDAQVEDNAEDFSC